ncbi:hypothetical protein [Granulosicoccus antarcticus]|uniref:Uncharacterized protein n=1 Tax=Granulosicoccus antarcticus IMCC3135 TaxID=1192854 RepID=A0A2Z2NH35_9GAMM|nr:hypothetical protein [Granulosicoccus antarcticus]ASJ70393.1 hypothetical protein IMCC3135_01370 [Granulosicoccus antarcticus IMCC3135]
MKLDSAEPESELQEGSDKDPIVRAAVEKLRLGESDTGMNDHDIRASLTIINGYSSALESSFQELRDLYNETLEQKDGFTDEARSARLMTLEADCRFCLSRMCGSVAKLKERLQSEGVWQVSSQN